MQTFELLERRLAEWSGCKHVVACSSGTAALHLALEALQIPLDSEVIVPEFTMVACARAVSMAGLKPIFVDCKEDLLLDDALLWGLYGPKVKAVMPVHIYGRKCQMKGICTFASQYNLAIIEDLAEAHGIRPHPNSDAACWSFYKNKIIAGEEGGAVAFKSPERAELARSLRCLGFTEKHDFIHIPRGHNYRLSNVHADLILKSLENFYGNSAKRRLIGMWYDELIPEHWQMPRRERIWVYDIRIPDLDISWLVEKLNKKGVAARLGFRPMSEQKEYRGQFLKSVAYKMSRDVFYLPVHPTMEQKDVSEIVSVLMSIVSPVSECSSGLAPRL